MIFKGTKPIILFALLTPLLSTTTQAADITSAYSKIDWDKDCKRIDTPPEGEPDLGGRFQCAGYQDFPIWISTGDLRESIQFGHQNDQMIHSAWESFGAFNQINTTIEWRLTNGKPFAAIYRHFIDSPDGNEANRGQFLIIKSVARVETGNIGCIYGMVNGREAKANETARLVADTMQNPLSKCVSGGAVDTYSSTQSAPYYRIASQDTSMSRSFPDPLQ